MNNYRLLNNISGWFCFLFALTVYALTIEPTGSLWDCGEFISAAHGLQVVHPPGAPLFLLIGRFFSLFAGSEENVAIAVNMLSATSAALCVLFTCWITTYFGRKLVEKRYGELTPARTYAIMLSGIVAGCTLTFTDTFWFSAVEAEVYAMSSFFMSFTFWCILKWEERAESPFADKWLVFIGYIVGLAIGVHLLNLLVIPAIVLVYYFKKYPYSTKGLIISLTTGFVALFFVQLFVIPYIPTLAAAFDRFFVNNLGMGFGSGVITFFVILIGLLVFGIWYSIKYQKKVLNTSLLAFTFMLIGYSSYAMVVIRSNAQTPINMNTPDDAFSLVYYLNREQYGDRPLLKGPHFETQRIGVKQGKANYIKGEKQYEFTHYSMEYEYNPQQMMFFPRIYDQGDPGHIQGYREWANIPEGTKPKMSHNLRFFFKYQLGHMYWRYFFWNFAGRQNDDQGFYSTEVMDGNWISGIPFIDAIRLGPQTDLPDNVKNNPSRNTYYLIPFVLGLLGFFMQFKSDKNGSLIMGILFLVTGMVLIIYLNPPPYEPRERDYVFVGSFQVFCTWIGLSVLFLFDFLSKHIASGSALAVAGLIGIAGGPVLEGTENWNDHDRSGRYMSTDFARNYLKSCAPNAVLFTNGDNDTYPLWYVQNVEKYRTDVRVVNLSLLNAADYVESLRRKQYDSEPLKLTFSSDQIRTGRRDYVIYAEDNNIANPNQYYNLADIMKFVANDKDPRTKKMRGGEEISYFPTKNFRIPVDKENVIKNKAVAEEDYDKIADEILFTLPNDNMSRSTLILLDVIANNLWERPVYFTTTTGSDTYVGLQDYFQVIGLTYKLVPIKTSPNQEQQRRREYGYVNTERMIPLLTDSFTWGGMDERDMWVDDKMRLVPNVMRQTFNRVAAKLVEEGKKDKAIALLQECEKSMPNHNLAYDGRMLEMVDTYYSAGAKEEARRLLKIITDRALENLEYLAQYKNTEKRNHVKSAIDQNTNYVQFALYIAGQKHQDKEIADALQARIQAIK